MHKINGFYLRVIIAIFTSILLTSSHLSAQGDLLITPRRVVFEGSKQSQELTLANTGIDTARYNVSFVQYRMNENGSFEQIEVPDSGQYFADKYLRFFPRSVTLAPNEAQVVRMQFRKLPDMKNGEYRSHVYFRAVPKETALGEEQLADSTAIGIRLIPIFGITIPVIIRVGELNLNVDLTDISLDTKSDTIPQLAVTFTRNGDKSVYGDLTVNWVSNTGGDPIEVGVVRGIAVYTPNKIRRFNMQLRKTEGVDYSRGKLVIKYQAPNDLKAEVYAEKEFAIK
ncbi:MAG: molecular chaperone [Lentimicrobiaceae bacterium]|nr:molecular chaperone [Lentimicrobiaceae bacterium]